MAVAAHHHEIGAAVGGVREQHIGDVDAAAGYAVDLDLEVMPGKILLINTFSSKPSVTGSSKTAS